jgi:hypothetical protein
MMEAVFGFLGVFVGSFIPWIKETIQQKKLRAQKGTYLAIRVICVLDEYIDKCVDVVQDDGTIMGRAAERDADGCELYIPQVQSPAAPVFPDDVDWKSLDSNLMYRILAFPNVVRETDKHISYVGFEEAFPPYHEELFAARWEGYINLGLEALEIIEALRACYNLKPKSIRGNGNPDWDVKEWLEKKKKEIEAQKLKQTLATEKMLKTLDKAPQS